MKLEVRCIIIEIITNSLPGFMELLPEEQIEFDRIKAIILNTYKGFGFTELDTPAIERGSTLLAKAGNEIKKQVYTVENRNLNDIKFVNSEDLSDPNLVLRFDLTVPLARYVAEHFNNLSFPFRRCHVAKVYRGERAQKGRFREFYQCDVDVIGKNELNIRYDAEIPSIIYQLFKKLNFGEFTIHLNNLKILNGMMASLDEKVNDLEILRIIDKIEKIYESGVIRLLENQNLSSKSIEKILKFVNINGSYEKVFAELKNIGIKNDLFFMGIAELETVVDFMVRMGVDPAYFKVDLSVARGLDYYTGTVYETKLNDYPDIGSICSGGRYDDLASCYTAQKLPGVGISIGLTRLFDKLREIGLISCMKKTIADVIIVPVDDINIFTSLRIAQNLREKKVKVDVFLESGQFKKKLKYISKKDAKFVIVVGTEEESSGYITVQSKIESGQVEKYKIKISELAEYLCERLKKNNL
ncbi:MAG: histidine--tRNA ligase [Candidatus Improbicoccus devescovinae]|nr:MAG: histidine--tRNA ligase [Candidatus Improbicoccus devescovinae]